MTESLLHGPNALQRHRDPTLACQPGSCSYWVFDACRCDEHFNRQLAQAGLWHTAAECQWSYSSTLSTHLQHHPAGHSQGGL